ncbi:MAG: hypothetical protein WCP35_18640 [Verrucomicrobiota bacterium]
MSNLAHLFELPLHGLREDNPRDFLAVLGLQRVTSHQWPESEPTLSWSEKTGQPTIRVDVEMPANWGSQLLDLLSQWATSSSNPFRHGKIEAISQADFHAILQTESTCSPFYTRFYPALSSQISNENSGRRSEFIIESANRSVLKGIVDLLADHRRPLDVAADFGGTSPMREVSNTSRWHPAEFQSAAYTATDPKENKHCDRLSLNVFALLGLTFYPVVDIQGGRKTPGIRRISRVTEFSWPVWSVPLGLDELASLLHHPAIHQSEVETQGLKALGIYQIWRSRKFCPDGKNDYFSTSNPAF